MSFGSTIPPYRPVKFCTYLRMHRKSLQLAGDFNTDGKVDAADYVVWRKTLGDATNYNIWRANFGKPGGGAGTGLTDDPAAVPEPSTLLLLCGLVGAIVGLRRNTTR